MKAAGYSLSTAWNWTRHANGADLIREITRLGFSAVELNFTLTRAIVEDVERLVRAGEVRVSSVHNICPLPEGTDPAEASPDRYPLSATDETIRRTAVAAARATIDWAGRLGAAAVVLHAGRVEIPERQRELAACIERGEDPAPLRAAMVDERASAAGSHLTAVIASLGELLDYARPRGIRLGIENRYYFREIPIAAEFDTLFRRFAPGGLFYWHDVGHAETSERLGLGRHRDLLDRFANRLLGIHLHDIIGLTQDHRAPGTGTFDFSVLRPYLTPQTIRVIEAGRHTTEADLATGADFIARVLAP